MPTLPAQSSDKTPLQDHCGIVGIFSSIDTPLFEPGYQALLTLQTRGYDGAGFWAIDKQGTEYQHKASGMIRQALSRHLTKYRHIPMHIILCQTRYGTSGNQSQDNIQPLRLQHHSTGEIFSLAHNGQFSQSKKTTSTDQSDTVLFAHQLEKHSTLSWDQRIYSTLIRQKGAFSLLIATKNSLYACRDNLGIRPLVYGRLSHNKPYQWIVASETSSIIAAGANHVKEIMPGQILKFTTKGVSQIKPPSLRKKAYCIFENVYLMEQNSQAHLPTNQPKAIRNSPIINQVRFRSGQILARQAPLTKTQVDMVIGIPGTGIAGGQGYANALRLPYIQAISDSDTPQQEQRTFMAADIDTITQKVINHFSIAGDMIKNKRLCLVDDSLVRGNITKGLIKLLKHTYHAKTIHVRILCPPINKPCYLGINTRQKSELIVHQHRGNLAAVKKHINADSLVYLTAQGLKEAITNDPKAKGFCMGCMQGHKPPINPFGKLL